MYGSPIANRTLTLFGAENVTSNAATEPLRRSDSPVVGSCPASSVLSASPVTVPDNRSAAAPVPTHSPAASGPPT
jgi:hypothetical protein